MAYRKLSNYVFNDKNPFIEETVHHVEKGEKMVLMTTKNPDMIVGSDGEIKGQAIFAKRTEYDKAEFRKIFISSISSFFDLSKAAIKVFSYIISSIDKNNDLFIFNIKKCLEFTGYSSKKTVINGISELLENKFIARGSNPYFFFINPTIFFNGDRITFLKQLDFKDIKDAKIIRNGNKKMIDSGKF